MKKKNSNYSAVYWEEKQAIFISPIFLDLTHI